ncbi:uncharacterized protein LOC126657195 [Mercurialis annua]|uniref:uncharacterized protein LOC126657195 n=1 Tax=Mercurialis annua TaxID=3986 RepID=UPI00216006BB|nr:uncharacterized protein LOC126657195 [Mercurialis annua]
MKRCVSFRVQFSDGFINPSLNCTLNEPSVSSSPHFLFSLFFELLSPFPIFSPSPPFAAVHPFPFISGAVYPLSFHLRRSPAGSFHLQLPPFSSPLPSAHSSSAAAVSFVSAAAVHSCLRSPEKVAASDLDRPPSILRCSGLLLSSAALSKNVCVSPTVVDFRCCQFAPLPPFSFFFILRFFSTTKMNSDRSWMYSGRLVRGLLTEGYISNVREFLNFAVQHPECMSGAQIKCPCPKPKCRNTAFRTVDEVEFHLYTDGFVSNYHVWTHHGEENRRVEVPVNVLQADNMWEHRNEDEGCSSFQRMVTDAGGPEVWTEEPPNAEAQKFYDMMRAAEEPIWPGNDRHSALSEHLL